MRGTRGNGFLEGFLATQRMRKADALIPDSLRRGRILDIGCGTWPKFLHSICFGEKHGIDRIGEWHDRGDVRFMRHDIAQVGPLPYADSFFSVVTMLAVVEHIEPAVVPPIFDEINRILAPGGVFILTTPAPWTDRLLRLLARLNLVSREEIEEHKAAYSPHDLLGKLVDAGFEAGEIRAGYFEAGMNVWCCAGKR